VTRTAQASARRGAKGRRRKKPDRRPPLPVIALAGVGILAVLLAVGGLLVRPAADAVEVGANRVVNDGGPHQLVDARNSPTVVRNPTDADNVVVVHRLDRPSYSAELHWSRDGGQQWSVTDLPLPAGLDRPFAPDVAFGLDGTLYVVYSHLEGPGNVPTGLWLARSEDGGQSLDGPWEVAGELAFQPRVVVHPDGNVHVMYVQAEDVAVLQFVGPVAVVAVHSDDGGERFTDPVPVSDPDRPRVGVPAPAVDNEGDLVVVYQDFKDNVRDFQNLEGPPWPEPAALVLSRSTDGGASFSEGSEFESGLVPVKRFLPFLPEFPSLAVGPDGDLLVVWSDGRNDDEDVFVRRSADGGGTWTEPVRVNDNPEGDGTSQYMPVVDVATDGRIDVAFLDRRHDPDDVLMDVYLAYSADGAASFSNVRVSSESFDSEIGATPSTHLPIDFGTRMGLVSDRGSALVAWTDTRLAQDVEHGRQDIFAARVSLPGSGLARLATLVALGALLAGLACLAAAGWLQRRRAR